MFPVRSGPHPLALVGVLSSPVDDHLFVLTVTFRTADNVPVGDPASLAAIDPRLSTPFRFSPNLLRIPNKLPLLSLRIFLVLLLGGTFWGQFVAAVLFILAAISDYWDGQLARKYGVGSRLGQFLDPLADKVLVLGAFFAFLFLPEDAAGNRNPRVVFVLCILECRDGRARR